MNSAQRDARERAYDPARLTRAAKLLPTVERLGPAQFVMRGSNGPRYVDLDTDPYCECEDRFWNGAMCKHIIAGRLVNGDVEMIQALGDLLLRAERHARAALGTRRGRRGAARQRGEAPAGASPETLSRAENSPGRVRARPSASGSVRRADCRTDATVILDAT